MWCDEAQSSSNGYEIGTDGATCEVGDTGDFDGGERSPDPKLSATFTIAPPLSMRSRMGETEAEEEGEFTSKPLFSWSTSSERVSPAMDDGNFIVSLSLEGTYFAVRKAIRQLFTFLKTKQK